MINPLKVDQVVGQTVILIKVHCNINRDKIWMFLLLSFIFAAVYHCTGKDRQQRKAAD